MESGDYNPGPWSGHDFKSARRTYDAHAGRSYSAAVSSGVDVKDLVVPKLSSESVAPLIIVSDVTGSMGEWPATMFSKLPYLDKEGQEYLGPDLEICFAAVGDAYSDQYPLQIPGFAKGLKLEEMLKKLVIEGNGGGQLSETYELAALYFLHNCDLPKAIHPILIFIGDEFPYPTIPKDLAKKFAGVSVEESRINTSKIFEQLKQKFSVYLIRKMYGVPRSGDRVSKEDEKIHAVWADLLGEDHIVVLPSADRVVDVIFGILAKETSRIDYFHKEIEGRQTKEQVDTVYKSLATVHQLTDTITKVDSELKALPGVSVSRHGGKGKTMRRLVED